MAELTHEKVDAQLAEALSGKPPGTAAELTDFAAAYWDGARVRYVFLHEDGHSVADEEFELTDYALEQWHNEISAWFAAPRYSLRPEILGWLRDSQPRDIGTA